MANIKSAKKRILVAETRAARNKAIRSKVKTAVKKVEAAVAAKDKAAAQAALLAATSEIDKATSKGVYHKNTASRKEMCIRDRNNTGRVVRGVDDDRLGFFVDLFLKFNEIRLEIHRIRRYNPVSYTHLSRTASHPHCRPGRSRALHFPARNPTEEPDTLMHPASSTIPHSRSGPSDTPAPPRPRSQLSVSRRAQTG